MAIAAAMASVFGAPSAFHVSNRQQSTDTVYLGTWRRETLEQMGGFNEQVGANEDYELNYRIRQAGGVVILSPLIHSEYYGRQSLPDLVRQYFSYGLSKVRTLRHHPRSLRLRQLAAPALVLALVGGSILGIFSVLIMLATAAIALAYAAAICFSRGEPRGAWDRRSGDC